MEIKDLYRRDGKLNSAILRREHFQQSELYLSIVERSNSLGADPSASIAERIFLYLSGQPRPKCNVCGEASAMFCSKKNSYKLYCDNRSCSATLAATKSVATKVRKYGSGASPLTREKARQRSEELNMKGRQTLLDRHGVSNPGQMKTHTDKVRSTLLQKYGANHQHQVKSAIEKRRSRSIDFYSSLVEGSSVTVDFLSEPSDYKKEAYSSPCITVNFSCDVHGRENLPSETFKWRARKFGNACSSCLRPYNKSVTIAQSEIAAWIESLGFRIKVNDNDTIAPKQIDIMIPEINVGIEYNGLYWHSYDRLETRSERNRHLEKLLISQEKSIHLIQVFEDEWIYKRDIVKSVISSSVCAINDKIFARKCKIVEVSHKISRQFLDDNHLQGRCSGEFLRIGLEHDGELVSLITIGKSRFERGVLEILRSASKIGTTVIGGFSKMMKEAEKRMKLMGYSSIVTYADRRYFTGATYEKYGFAKVGESSPGFFYTDKDRRFSRMQFQKHMLPSKLPIFDPNLSESENMFRNGYRRIWDCGQLKFILNF